MGEAWFGLIGVIVGGVITGGADFMLQRRNEKRLRRSASRLLGLELDEAIQFIEASDEAGCWGAAPTRVSNEQWMEYRSVWAAEDDEWQKVAEAFLRIAHVRQHAFAAEPGAPLDDTERGKELIRAAIAAISQARPLLDPSGADHVNRVR